MTASVASRRVRIRFFTCHRYAALGVWGRHYTPFGGWRVTAPLVNGLIEWAVYFTSILTLRFISIHFQNWLRLNLIIILILKIYYKRLYLLYERVVFWIFVCVAVLRERRYIENWVKERGVFLLCLNWFAWFFIDCCTFHWLHSWFYSWWFVWFH